MGQAASKTRRSHMHVSMAEDDFFHLEHHEDDAVSRDLIEESSTSDDARTIDPHESLTNNRSHYETSESTQEPPSPPFLPLLPPPQRPLLKRLSWNGVEPSLYSELEHGIESLAEGYDEDDDKLGSQEILETILKESFEDLISTNDARFAGHALRLVKFSWRGMQSNYNERQAMAQHYLLSRICELERQVSILGGKLSPWSADVEELWIEEVDFALGEGGIV